MKNKKSKIIFAILILIALFAVLTLNGMFYIVEENQHIFVIRFSKVVEQTSEAGIYFKLPFIDEIKTYPQSTQVYSISESTVNLKDKTNMVIDSYVLWRIKDPMLFYTSVSTIEEAENRLNMLAYNHTKSKFNTLETEDFINLNMSGSRNEIYGIIKNLVDKDAENYGIEVLDVKVKRIDLPKSNEADVYERMITERNSIAALRRAEGNREASFITNEIDKICNTLISNAKVQAEQLIAEGETLYMQNLSEAYKTSERLDFYTFLRSLQAFEKSMSGENKTIILDKESELAKIIMSVGNNG